MKNKTFFYLFIIIIISILLRFWSLDKPEGLWNDEYVSWFIASRKSFSEFISLISRNCHTPLYYLFLKFWLMLFPDTDISLRISSVITSILTVISMFFLGKEYKDTKTGLLCSFFTAVSSFYIYFAQEVRLYSLLSLITVLTLIYCIKTLKTGKKLFFLLFIIFNALLCCAHTLGLIFSFFIILLSLIYLYKNYEEWKEIITNFRKTIQYISPFIIVLILLAPFIISIVFSKSLSQFWSVFSYSKVAFSFIDLFSPFQCNIINSPDTFRTYLFKGGSLNLVFVIFALIPSFMAVFAILKAYFLKDKILNILLYTSLGFVSVNLILSAIGKIVFLTKYSCEIYPVLILAFVTGILSLKNCKIKQLFFIIYFLISLIYLYYSPNSAPKMTRPEGNHAPILLIKQSRLKHGDYILLTYYDTDKFERYMPDKKAYKIFSVNKFNFNNVLFNNKNYYETIKQGKWMYRTKFKEHPNTDVVNYANETFIKNMKKGDRIGLIFLNGVSFLSNQEMNEIVDDDIKYKKSSFIFLCFSALRNSIMYAFKNDFKIDSITQAGDWTLIVYEKID